MKFTLDYNNMFFLDAEALAEAGFERRERTPALEAAE